MKAINRYTLLLLGLALLAGLLGVQSTLPAWADDLDPYTIRVSIASDGTQADDNAYFPSVSADGRFVAFHSGASNLVPGDTNESWDVFVHDRVTGTTTRVSVASDGTEGNRSSEFPSISADGRFVAFRSQADNLVPGDTNNASDIFVHDRETGATTRVSVASDGSQANTTTDSPPSISANGRYVAFASWANNLVPDDTNGVKDIFVHDRETGAATRVSVSSDGTQASGHCEYPSISADGRYVAFQSSAKNLVPGISGSWRQIFVHDRATGTTTLVSTATDGTLANQHSAYPTISADGRYVAFRSIASNLVPGDTNGNSDVFVHDLETGTTTRVSVASDGTQANGGSNGSASAIVPPSISADGRYVAFYSGASNLIPNLPTSSFHAYVHDRETGTTTLVSVASDGTPANRHTQWSPVISTDGQYVAFPSMGTNLVPDDTNNRTDVFLRKWIAPPPPVTGIINGDFEDGPAGWVQYSPLGGSNLILEFPNLPVYPHSGNWAVWLGGDFDKITYISQTVTVPTTQTTLTLWEWIVSGNACGSDTAMIRVNGNSIVTISLCMDTQNEDWVQRSVDLRAYAGQTIDLQIRVEVDQQFPSDYYVDNIVFVEASPVNLQTFLPCVLK